MADDDFKSALTRIASDPEYRQRAQKKPDVIQKDFGLSIKELQALRQVAVLSGADIKAVDELRGKEIAKRSARTDLAVDDIDVSCCTCCCCCCGETAVVASLG